MESLLKWSLENTPADEPSVPPTAERIKELDPAIIDMILGKSDAVIMKEKLAIAQDESREEDERVEALDDFEMLVEQIDNANSKLGEHEDVGAFDRTCALTGARGTAACDMDCRDGGAEQFRRTKQLLETGPLAVPTVTRHIKSSVGKHTVQGVVLPVGLVETQYPDITVRRKAAFLINTLLLQDISTSGSTAVALHASDGPEMHGADGPVPDSTEGLVKKAVMDHKLIHALVQPPPYGPHGDGDAVQDHDYREKVLQTVDTFVRNGGELGDAAESVAAFKQARGA
ncbi:unnamed protein product [Rhizoctonia solani]|uniref:Nucleotide exchange factor Fes1 domain-containing protein n=1 Tax=Rhizoctonia solani TaxID=456999 RepID=A0A8H3BBL4_9AGAM|nr:unnamed protein product [Rhizoctonia solani]